jgi:SAM-dependent methyltransferase
MDELTEQAKANRAWWDAHAEDYQREHGEFIGAPDPRWGMWQVPEDELGVLGDVSGRDVLELGCGGGQWAIALARRGARVTGLDNSDAQLEHARDNARRAGVGVELVHASAEALPFAEGSFDVVFCDFGAMLFADPYLTVPEVARVLRPGGTFAFSDLTPFNVLFYDAEHEDDMADRPVRDYFGLHRIEWSDGMVEFNLPYGEWIRLFVRNDLEVVDLLETQPAPGATSTYRSEAETAWARRWPMEHIWVTRRRARGRPGPAPPA